MVDQPPLVNDIELIVHPLYHFRNWSDADFAEWGQEAPQKMKIFRLVVKQALNQFGQYVKRVKDNPESALLLVETGEPFKIPFIKNGYTRLLAYAEKELGRRFVLLPNSFGYSHDTQFITSSIRLSRLRFDHTVHIHASGHYRDLCVTNASHRLMNQLQAKGAVVFSEKRKETLMGNQIERFFRRQKQPPKLSSKAFSDWRRQTFGKRKPAPTKPKAK